MPITDFGHDSSDSENDDALLADIQALSKACCSTALGDASGDGAVGDTTQTTESAAEASDGRIVLFAANSSDSDDDFEFLRDVQHKYGASDGADPGRTNFVLPFMNSDSDDDDDFEILRSIQKRFGQYSASGTNCVGLGEFQGMSSNDNNDLNLPVHELSNDGVSDQFDVNEEGFCDSAPKDDADKQRCHNTELPKCALAFIDAIRKNRLAQKHIRNQMTSVEARMEKVKEMIKRVKVICEFDIQEKRKMARKRQDDRVQLISVPNKDSKKVSSAMKHGPPENSRVVNYRNAFNQYPQWITKERWTKEDQMNLRKGVIQQVQKFLLLKSMDRMNESEDNECMNGVDDIMCQIGDVQDPQTIKSFLPNVDWEELAMTYLPKRSGPECQARWMNFDDPLINHDKKWGRLEDKCLLDYVQQLEYNWVAIAELLGTNRTPYQCLTRYQRSLNRSLMNREWTSDQDAELTAAVHTYGESNWTVVASALEGRTGPQCSNRWLKTLLPSKQRKGRWNADEDKRLKIAVMIMGSKCWNKIAEFVPGRTQARCRDRWMNCLDPSLNLGKWTEAEDAKLEEAIREHGYCWAKIASCVPPRTDSQCRRRWIALFPDEALRVKAERKAIRDALPSNFVDREPNRPALEANDFTPLLLLGNTEVEPTDISRKGKKKAAKRPRRKNSNKISDTAFCNIPKKSRSRRCRRVDIRWEYPVIRNSHPSEVNGTLPRRSTRTRGSGIKRKKLAEADSTLAVKKKSVKGTRNRRKGGENETTIQCNHAEVEAQSVSRDLDAESVCLSGSVVMENCPGTEPDGSCVQEEYQQVNSSVASISEVVNCSVDTIEPNDRGDAIFSHCEVTGKQPKRRRLTPKEPEGPARWEHVPLTSLFVVPAKVSKKKAKL